MAVDPYAPCPCGSGKKLKFCCGDLATEIEKIDKLVEADQPRAALAQVEHLLAKDPTRASLLDIRAMLELSLEEFDAAEKTLAAYIAAHPDSPGAYAQAAMLAAARELPLTAVEKLQDALERLDREMPARVFEAIGTVGHALLVSGDIIAARGHLLFFAAVSPEGDSRAVELLLRLNLQANMPLPLRDQLRFQHAPDKAPYKRGLDEALRLADRGLWRRAEAELAKLVDRDNPQPPVVYDLALVRGWLGDRQQFVEGLRQYSKLDVPLDDAVEAEALAQLVDNRVDEPKLESVRISYPILDEDKIAERLAGDRRVERYEFDPAEVEEDDLTRPRSSHLILDRPAPRTGVGLPLDEAPNVLAFASVYGKRTDRGARLEVTTDRGKQFALTQQITAEICGDAIGPAETTEVVGMKPASEEALSWRWRLPDDTPPPHRRQLLAERRRRAFLDDWTKTPQGVLKGFAPQEAAPWPDSKIPLLATIQLLEQTAADPAERELFQELRQKLGLPLDGPIDPQSADLNRLPLVRLPRLELAKVSDNDLMRLFNRVTLAGAGSTTLALAREIVSRPGITQGVDTVYRHLIRGEPDPDRALAWTAEAKRRAAELGTTAGQWGVLELEVQIERGDPQGVQAALHDLRANHFNEQGVPEAVYQLLYTAGLIDPRQMNAAVAARGAGPAPAAVPAPAGRIWTPDQGEPSPPAGGAKSAIWTP